MEEFRFKTRKEYAKALDSVILSDDIQVRDLGGSKKHRYFPIPIKEAIADYIFQYWNVVKEDFNQINQMYVCTIKLVFVPDYPDGQEMYCTGSAAVLINSAKNNLEFQLPAVRSEAIGNALGSLGNIFGRNLSRKLKKGIDMPDGFTLREVDKKEPEPEKPKTETKEVKTPPF